MPLVASPETNPRYLMQPVKITYHLHQPLIPPTMMRQLLLQICPHSRDTSELIILWDAGKKLNQNVMLFPLPMELFHRLLQ